MRKFRLLTLVLCAAMLTGVAGAAFVPVYKDHGETIWGTIDSVEENTVRIKNNSGQGHEEVVVHMQDNAPIIDAVTGAAVKLADVKLGQRVYVSIGLAMTMSLPPQTSGLGMVVNLPADFKAPEYGVIHEVTVKDDGTAEILTADNTLLGRVSADTKLLRYVKPGEPAVTSLPTISELKPGCVVYLWYGVSTKSVPAQANLDQVLIVPSAYDGDVAIGEGKIAVDGADLVLTEQTMPVQTQDKEVLVPLRAVAEAAGWSVSWTANDAPITLSKGERTLRVTIGQNTVTDSEETHTVLQNTQLRGGVTFVDSSVLELYMNLYTVITA